MLSVDTRRTLGLWLVLAFVWGVLGANRRWGELYDGAMSDHASHLTRVRLLLHFGPRVWTTPAEALPLDALPDAHVNWPELPAMYPVGMFVLHAPLALLVECGALSLDRAALWAIELYLLAFATLMVLLAGGVHARRSDGLVGVLLLVGTLGFVVRGFYDVVPMVALVLAFHAAAEERPDRALTWWSVAALLHYRAFFTLPFAGWWAWQLVQQRRWRPLVLSSALTTPSAVTFLASAPFLSALPETNPTRALGPRLAVLVTLVAWLGWCATRQRVRREGLLLALCLALTLLPRQTMSWHALLLWPALLSFRREEPPVERWARYALGMIVTFVGLRGEWPGRWLSFL